MLAVKHRKGAYRIPILFRNLVKDVHAWSNGDNFIFKTESHHNLCNAVRKSNRRFRRFFICCGCTHVFDNDGLIVLTVG